MKIVDALGIVLVAIGIAMTVLLFFGRVGPSVEVRDLTIHEIPAPPPVQVPHDRI